MARKPIQDEYTELPVSKQRKYQLRRGKAGRCTTCGAPAISSNRCLTHLVKKREYMRKKIGAKRRYHSLGYRLAEQAKQGKQKQGGRK